MNRLIFCIFVFFTTFCCAATHPGLKTAVDNNDIKKAEALIKNLGVKDVYCPASLSITNAEKLYGNVFKEKPEIIFENCEPEFITSYSKQFCMKKETVSLCKEFLNRTPINQWVPYLEQVEKNKLNQIQESYTTKEDVLEKTTTKECLAELQKEKKFINAVLAQLYENSCSDPFSCKLLYEPVRDSIEILIKIAEKKCQKTPTRKVKKKVTKTRTINLFDSQMLNLANYINPYLFSPFNYNDSIKTLFNLYKDIMMDFSHFQSEEKALKMFSSLYAQTGDIPDSTILAYCRLYPDIDKRIEKLTEVSLFSCKATEIKYTQKCNAMLMIMIPKTVNGIPAYYICDGKAWHEATPFEYDTYNQVCSKSIKGQMQVGNINKDRKYMCDGKHWVKTTVIGNQTWLAENLNIPLKGSYCYDNLPEHCEQYGRLYPWEIAMKACPTGWHLPINDEWKALDDFIRQTKYDGTNLNIDHAYQAINAWQDGQDMSDDVGFSALPAGIWEQSGSRFSNIEDAAVFWTATDVNLDAYYKNIGRYEDFGGGNAKSNAYSVRCVKD